MSIQSKHIDVRLPAVAGLFYPEKRDVLIKKIDELFSRVEQRHLDGTVVALISPHAGYDYSGLTAAHGFSLIKEKSFHTVVIVSPSHREYFEGICVFSGSTYRTPLGDLNVDTELRKELLDYDPLIMNSVFGHRQEHAIEVQLPFLQRKVGNVNILPIVMGDQRRNFCYQLGNTLGTILQGKSVLIVASTDLSHHYPYDVARKLDKIFIDNVAKFDYEQLLIDIEGRRTEGCGVGPTVAVLLAAKKMGAQSVHILHHCNSGDVTGEKSGVVGYLSAAVVRSN